MKLQIAKWGNSLALRLPTTYIRYTGFKAGDKVQASLTADGSLSIHPADWNRKAFSQELATYHDTLPIGKSVIDQLRKEARY